MGKLSRDKRDVYYRAAKDAGYRARSAYKLLQIDAEFDLFGEGRAGEEGAGEGAGEEEGEGSTSSSATAAPAPASGAGAGAEAAASTDDADRASAIRPRPRRPPLRVRRAVDLCAAPGGWTQVLAERALGGGGGAGGGDGGEYDDEAVPAIVAVDLWPMEPLPGADVVRGDITSLDTAEEIVRRLRGRRAEVGLFSLSVVFFLRRIFRLDVTICARDIAQLVVCDGAPDVTGLRPFDEYVQHQLFLSAVNIATHVLCPGGTFVGKIFRGRDVGLVYAQLLLLFEEVTCAKPAASRHASVESFAVCRGFCRGQLDASKCLDLELEGGWDEACGGAGGLRVRPGEDVVPVVVPFVACKNLRERDEPASLPGGAEFMDADKSYDFAEAKAPLAPPIEAPYDEGRAKAKEARAAKASKKKG
ncbi:hypothetical protein ACHAWF_017594 [Thalassiosira exigua]